MKVTIIGAGNMGGAIARGIASGKIVKPEEITMVDPSSEALEKLRATGLPFVLTHDLRGSIPGADILVLAVKPFKAEEVIDEVRDLIDFQNQILFSIVAGATFDQLNNYLFRGEKKIQPIQFRVMPNTAASVQKSMTFIAQQNATKAQIRLVETLVSELGETMLVPESLMNAAMSLGSCGIAFVMRFVRAAMEGGIEVGFSAEQSLKIVTKTMEGAVKLLLEGGQHPEVEIDKVTTPGGFTIRGLNAMEENGFTNAVISGIRAATQK
jgi:pyrroline-5-carboxylate reductase